MFFCALTSTHDLGDWKHGSEWPRNPLRLPCVNINANIHIDMQIWMYVTCMYGNCVLVSHISCFWQQTSMRDLSCIGLYINNAETSDIYMLNISMLSQYPTFFNVFCIIQIEFSIPDVQLHHQLSIIQQFINQHDPPLSTINPSFKRHNHFNH